MAAKNKFGWHSGTLKCKNVKVLKDLYVTDDIVFSDVSAGSLGVTGGLDMSGAISAIGIDMGGTFSTVAINIDGTCLASTASAIQVTLDYDFSASGVGENYPSAIRLDLTQTAVGATMAGGFYGVHARLHAAYGNLGTYGLFSRCYVTATGASQKINDVVGVMGEIRVNGADTKYYADTSSISAVRGSISNSSTGKFQGQVFGLMLDYGMNQNNTGETALIFGYSHADVYLDYGMHLISNSATQALTAGIYLESASGSTITTGINIDGAGTITTGIDIGTATTGLEFSGTVTEGIVFNSATFAAGVSGAISSRALTIGDRDTEFTIPFQGGVTVENFEPIQMVTNVTGTNPASLSKINMIYQQLTHDTTAMANLRLKCADFTISVNEACKDVYAYQGEIAFGAGTFTVGGEVATMGLVLNGGSGTITANGGWRVLNLTARGAGLPVNTAGLYIQCESGCTLTDGIRIQTQATGTITEGIMFGNTSGTSNTCPTNMFKVPPEGSGFVSDTTNVVFNTDPVKIKILVGAATYYLLAAKDFT